MSYTPNSIDFNYNSDIANQFLVIIYTYTYDMAHTYTYDMVNTYWTQSNSFKTQYKIY